MSLCTLAISYPDKEYSYKSYHITVLVYSHTSLSDTDMDSEVDILLTALFNSWHHILHTVMQIWAPMLLQFRLISDILILPDKDNVSHENLDRLHNILFVISWRSVAVMRLFNLVVVGAKVPQSAATPTNKMWETAGSYCLQTKWWIPGPRDMLSMILVSVLSSELCSYPNRLSF